MTVETQF